MTIDALVNLPSRSQAPATFIANANACWPQLNTFATQANALAASLNTLANSMGVVSAGSALSVPYTFSTTTTDSDPGAGVMRFNASLQNTSTALRIDLFGSNGSDWTDVIDSFDDSTSAVKGQITVVKATDGSKWITFNVTSLAAPAGYRNISVAVVGSSSASPFSNGDSLLLKFSRNGDKGDTGTNSPITVTSRTSNTILVSGDSGNLIDITSGTFTQTFTAAATMGNGWNVFYKNSGAGVVTLDPNGSETIDGGTTLILFPGMAVLVYCNGASFKTLNLSYVGDHEVAVTTGNGYGSTNTKIRRFTTTTTSVGTAVTYADSATDGALFTINETGLYAVSYTDQNAGAGANASFGVSVNSTQLTTGILTITSTNKLCLSSASGSSNWGVASRIAKLSAGDLVRPHTGATVQDGTTNVTFTIRKVGV